MKATCVTVCVYTFEYLRRVDFCQLNSDSLNTAAEIGRV